MKKQIVVTVTEEAQEFINSLCSTYQGPGVTKDTDLTQREAVDTLIAFAEAHRFQPSTKQVEHEQAMLDEDGNPIMGEDGNPIMETITETVPCVVDAFELEVKRTLALREVTSRAAIAKAKLESKEQEIAQLKAQLAKLAAKLGVGA